MDLIGQDPNASQPGADLSLLAVGGKPRFVCFVVVRVGFVFFF